MLNMPSITDKLDLKGRFLKKKISQSLNAHWLVFIVNNSTDRYMRGSSQFYQTFTACLMLSFLDYNRQTASKRELYLVTSLVYDDAFFRLNSNLRPQRNMYLSSGPREVEDLFVVF